jgi:hypothetical protein
MKLRLGLLTLVMCWLGAGLHAQQAGKMVHFPGAASRTNNQTAPGTLTSDPESQTLIFTQGGKPGVVIAYWQIGGIEANGAGDTATIHYKSSTGEKTATFSASAAQGQSLLAILKMHIPNATVTMNNGLQRLRLPERTNNQSLGVQPPAAKPALAPRTNNQ